MWFHNIPHWRPTPTHTEVMWIVFGPIVPSPISHNPCMLMLPPLPCFSWSIFFFLSLFLTTKESSFRVLLVQLWLHVLVFCSAPLSLSFDVDESWLSGPLSKTLNYIIPFCLCMQYLHLFLKHIYSYI